MAIRKSPFSRKKVELQVEEGKEKNPFAKERPKLEMKLEDKHGNSLDYIKPTRATKVGRPGVAYGATAGLAADDIGDLTSQAQVLGEDGEYTDAQITGVDLALAQFYMEGHDEAEPYLTEYYYPDED
jgi:hypothetical protein